MLTFIVRKAPKSSTGQRRAPLTTASSGSLGQRAVEGRDPLGVGEEVLVAEDAPRRVRGASTVRFSSRRVPSSTSA